MVSRQQTARLWRLPLVTLYLTERCNSRCVTCDYWRHGVKDVSLDGVRRLIPSLERLGTRVALLSGGEPLLNREWLAIAQALRDAGINLWLLTSGLSLVKHAKPVSQLFEVVTVSLDGTCGTTYAAIRGLDAFDQVCEGIRAAVALGSKVGLRVTLQRANYRELPDFVELAHELGVNTISFLAVDVANPHAFGRTDAFASDIALGADDLPLFGALISRLEQERAADFESRFIAESPAKLRRLQQYFAAILGRGAFPPVRCNAPEFSAVVGVSGQVQPCFFIAGPPRAANEAGLANTRDRAELAAASAAAAAAAGFVDLERALNEDSMTALRDSIRAGERVECVGCVCSLYRDPATVERTLLP